MATRAKKVVKKVVKKAAKAFRKIGKRGTMSKSAVAARADARKVPSGIAVSKKVAKAADQLMPSRRGAGTNRVFGRDLDAVRGFRGGTRKKAAGGIAPANSRVRAAARAVVRGSSNSDPK